MFNGICHQRVYESAFHADSLIGMLDKFSAFIKDSPIALLRNSNLNDGGPSDAARSLTFRVRWSLQTPGNEAIVDPKEILETNRGT
jgi:hypothetical protein